MRNPTWMDRLRRRWRRRRSKQKDEVNIRFQLSRLEERRVLTVTAGLIGVDVLQISMDAAGDTATVSMNGANLEVNGTSYGSNINSIVVEATADDDQTLEVVSDLTLVDGITVLAAEDVDRITLSESITSTTGDIRLEADEQLTLAADGDLNSDSGDITLGSNNFLSMSASSRVDADADGAASAGGDISVSASRLGLGEIVTDGDVSLIATSNEVTDQAAITVGGSLNVDAQSFVHLNSLDANGGVRLRAASGSITVVNSGDLDLRDADAATHMTLTSTNGSISDASGGVLDSVAAGGGLQLSVNQDVDLDSLNVAGNIGVTAGGNARLVNLGDVNLNASNVVGDLDVTSTTGQIFDAGSGATASALLFDFDGSLSSTTAAGYTSVLPNQTYNAIDGFGWESAVAGLDRSFVGGPRLDLRNDAHFGAAPAVFRVDLANGDYFVNINLGDVFSSDAIRLTMLGAPNQVLFDGMSHGPKRWFHDGVHVTVVNGALRLEVSDQGGATARWLLNSLEITPVAANQASAVSVPGLVTADGATIDTITGTGAANEIYTVTIGAGEIVSADSDSIYLGHQIQAALDGSFSVDIRRPTAAGLANLTIESIGGQGDVQLDQADDYSFYLAPVRKFDLNRTVVEPGYAGIGATQLYSPANAVGWSTAVGDFSWVGNLGAPEEVLRDGHFSGASATFQVSVEVGKTYKTTLFLADITQGYPDIQVAYEGVPTFAFAYGVGTVVTLNHTLVAGDSVLDIGMASNVGNWILNGVNVEELNPTAPPAVEPSFRGKAGTVEVAGNASFNAPLGHVALDDFAVAGLVSVDALNSSMLTTVDLRIGTVVVDGAGEDFYATAFSNDVTLGDLTVDNLVSITAQNGSILDDLDGGATDVDARFAMLVATGAVGATANPLEVMLTALEVDSGTDLVLDSSGNLMIGGVGGLAGAQVGGNASISGSGDLTLDEAISAANRITINVSGNLIDDADLDVDLVAPEAVITAANVGDAGDALETSLARVEGAHSGSVNIDNDQTLTIGGIGLLPGLSASGDIQLSNNGNVVLDSQLSAGGLVRLDVSGDVLDDSDADIDLAAARAVLEVTGDVGVLGMPIDVQVSALEGNIGGGLFLASNSALAFGGASAFYSGLSAARIDVDSTGSLTIAESVMAVSGPIDLQSDAMIAVDAAVTSAGQMIALDATGDVTFSAAGSIDTQTAASVDINSGGQLLMANGSSANAHGGALVVLTQNDATLSSLQSLGGAVRVESLAGGIFDGGAAFKEIDAATAELKAAGDIGAAGNLLETQLSQIEAEAGSIFLDNMGPLVIGGLGATSGLTATVDDIRLVNLGDVQILEALTAVDLITLLITGSVLDEPNLGVDVSSTSLIIDVTGGVGAGNPLETQVTNLEGDVGGDVRLDNTGALNIGGASPAEDGLTANSVDISSSGALVVGEDVQTLGGQLRLISGSTMDVNANVQSNGNDVELHSVGDMAFDANGNVDAQLAANVLLSTAGALAMTDGAAVDASGGMLGVLTVDNATLSSLISLGGGVTVSSSTGSILDGGGLGKEVDAATAVLIAAGEIGAAGNALETRLANLEASAGMNLWLANMGPLTIGAISALDGLIASGEIELTNNDDVLLDESIAAARVRINVNTGSLLDDGDVDRDLSANDAILVVDGAAGIAADGLEMSVSRLEGNVSGNANLHNDIDIAIGGVDPGFAGLAIGGELNFDADSNLTLDELLDIAFDATIGLGGGVLDDADLELDLRAQRLVLTVVGDAGTAADLIETELDFLELAGGAEIALSNTGGLQVGGIGAVVGVSTNGGNVLLKNDADVTLDESVSASRVEILVTGSVLDNDMAADIIAARAIVAATVDVGKSVDSVELQVDQLELFAGRDLFAANDRDIIVGGNHLIDGVQATGDLVFNNAGAVALDERMAAGASMLLIVNGDVTDDADAELDLAANALRVDVSGNVGSSGDRIETGVARLEGTVSGNFTVNNDQTLTIAGLNPVDGLAVGGDVFLLNQADVVLDERLSSGGEALLNVVGAITDDGDLDLDLVASQAAIQATGVGVVGDRLETSISAIEVASGAGVFFSNNGPLTVGGVNGLAGITAVGNVAIDNVGDVLLDESISSAGTTTLDVTGGGSLLDDADVDVDLAAVSAVLNVAGSIGAGADAVETQLAKLEGAAGANVFVINTGALVIGGIGAVNGLSAGGRIEITNDADVELDEAIAATNDIIANISGSLLDDGDADIDLAAAGAELMVSGSVGTAADSLETMLLNIEGLIGGEVVLVNTGPLTIGGVGGPINGLSAASADISASGNLQVDESITTNGSVRLQSDADIDLAASVDTQIAAPVVLIAGGELKMADGVTVDSHGGAINASAQGDVTLGGLISLGGAVVVDSAMGNILDGGGAHKEIDATSAVLTSFGQIGASGNALDTRLAMLEAEGSSIYLDNMGSLIVGDVNGVAGVVANLGDVQLNNMGDVALHEALTAGGLLSLTVVGSVRDQPNPAVDVNANRLLLDVSGDFGVSGEAIETSIAFLEGVVGGEFVIDNNGALTVGGVSAMDGLDAGAANIRSSGALQVNETLRVRTGPLLVDGMATVGVNASVLTNGADAMLHADADMTFSSLGVLDAQSNANLTVSTDANLFMHDLAIIDGSGGAVDVKASGNATVSHLKSIGGEIALESAGGSILDAGESRKDIEAANAVLTAGVDVGAAGAELETRISAIEAIAGGDVRFANMGDLEIGGIGPANGITAGGIVELQNDSNVLLKERVRAGVRFHATVGGALLDDGNSTVDIDSPQLLLDIAGDGGLLTDALELQIGSLEGTLGGQLNAVNLGSLTIGGVDGPTNGLMAAAIALGATDSIQIDEDVSSPGDVALVAGSDASGGDSIVMGGAAMIAAGNASLEATADVIVSSVTSLNDILIVVGGRIRDHADDALTDLNAGAETILRAAAGIDGLAADGKLELANNTRLDAIVSGPGDLRIRFNGAGTIRQASTFDGTIDVMAAGLLDAQAVSAGDADASGDGHVQIVNAVGDVLVGLVTAADDVLIEANGGSILDQAADASVDVQAGDTIRLLAEGKIADPLAGDLEVAGASMVDAQSLLSGDVRIASPGALTMLQLSTGAGDAKLTAVDAITIHATDIGGNLQVDSASGDITNPNGQIAVSGSASFSTTSAVGEISVGQTNSARITGPISLASTGDASISNDLDIDFDVSNIGGNLLAMSQGNIINTAGSLSVTGMASFDAAQTIKLGVANTLDVAQAIGARSGADTILNTANAIDFKASLVGGNLMASSNGAITNLSGSLDVALMTTLSGSEVRLGLANNFSSGGPVGLNTVGDAVLQMSSDLDLKASNIGGDLFITMQGGNLTDSGAVTTGDASLISTVALSDILLDLIDIAGVLHVDATGNAVVRNAGTLDVATGVSLGQLTLESLGGDLQYVAGLSAGSVLQLAAAGSLNGTGLLKSPQVNLSAGGGIGNLASLQLEAQSVSADSAGAGNIDLINDSGAPVIVTSLSTIGGDILFEQQGAAIATFNGAMTSGGAVDGGNIEVLGESGVVVLASATLSSLGGTGGRLSISGAQVDTTPMLGAGDIIIRGGGGDVIITVDIISDMDIDISADRDIIVLATVRTTDSANISLTADADLDGVGGLWVTEVGEVDSDGQLMAVGSDLFATPFELDAILIDDDAAGFQVRSRGDLSLRGRDLTADTAVVINGEVATQDADATLEIVGLDVEIGAGVGSLNSPGGLVRIAAPSPREITLGADVAGTLSLSSTELDAVSADVVVVGDPSLGGEISVAGRIDSMGSLVLASADMISGAGVLAVNQLGLIGSGSVALTGLNELGMISASLASGELELVHSGVLQIGSIAGVGSLADIDGLDVAGGSVTLDVATTVQQFEHSPIQAAELLLLGAGDHLLTSSNNNIGVLAADVGGKIDYRDSSDVTFGAVHSVDGVTALDDIRVHVAGSLTFQAAITSIGNQVELITEGNTVFDQNTTTNDVTTNILIIVTSSGVGTANNPLETTVGSFEGQAGSGGLFLVNDGALVIGGVSQANGGIAGGATSTGGAISITANSPLTVVEEITNSGDIQLTASPSGGADNHTLSARVVSSGDGSIELSAGDDIVVNDSSTDPEVFASGNGPIVFRAGGDVVIANDVVMGSQFGSFVTFPQVEEGVTLLVEPVEQGGSNVASNGQTTIRVRVGVPGEQNYRVTVDWHDGVIDDYPFVGGGSGGPKIPGGVDLFFSHRYGSNPSPNPADPIPVTVTIGLDAQQTNSNQVINGIQFFTNGDFNQQLVTTVSRLQTVPGEGIQTYIPAVVHELDPIVARPQTSGLILNQSASSADAETETSEFRSAELEGATIGELRVFFRVVDDIADKEEPKDYDLPVDSLKDVLRQFEQTKLRNGHYRIYVEDPATGKIRLMHDVQMLNGKLVPTNFRQGDGERLPGSNDGAATQPAGELPSDVASKLDGAQRNAPLHTERDGKDFEQTIQSPPLETDVEATTETRQTVTRRETSIPTVEHIPDSTTSWRTQSRIAALAAGAVTIAVAGTWRERLESSSAEEPYDLSIAARRRRRLQGKK